MNQCKFGDSNCKLCGPGPHRDDGLPWTVEDGRGSLSECVVMAQPRGSGADRSTWSARSIVAKGSRETCEFIARVANATLTQET
jgi:hypothetical protein